jgi:hypothetical protein
MADMQKETIAGLFSLVQLSRTIKSDNPDYYNSILDTLENINAQGNAKDNAEFKNLYKEVKNLSIDATKKQTTNQCKATDFSNLGVFTKEERIYFSPLTAYDKSHDTTVKARITESNKIENDRESKRAQRLKTLYTTK